MANYLNFDGLEKYDVLIKDYISNKLIVSTDPLFDNGKEIPLTIKEDNKAFVKLPLYHGENEGGVSTGEGVGIESVEQTTTSTESGGENIITCTLTNGTTSEFTIKNGTNGKTITYIFKIKDGELYCSSDGGTAWWSLGQVVGSDGATGPQGPQGLQGVAGKDGADGNGIASIEKTFTSGLVDTYTITYTDGTYTTFTVTNGKNGANGTSGSGEASVIIADVLPTTDIIADAIYKVPKYELIVFGGTTDPMYCEAVVNLPNVGEPVYTTERIYAYYNLGDSNVYGYLDENLSATAGIPVGWYALSLLAQFFGLGYGGVLTDITQAQEKVIYLVISDGYYVYTSDGYKEIDTNKNHAPYEDLVQAKISITSLGKFINTAFAGCKVTFVFKPGAIQTTSGVIWEFLSQGIGPLTCVIQPMDDIEGGLLMGSSSTFVTKTEEGVSVNYFYTATLVYYHTRNSEIEVPDPTYVLKQIKAGDAVKVYMNYDIVPARLFEDDVMDCYIEIPKKYAKLVV